MSEQHRKRGRPRTPQSVADVRTGQMRALRAQGLTNREIGERFGVSRERVRQRIGNTGRTSAKGREAKARTIAEQWRKYFKRVALDWLAQAGIRKCYSCHLWRDFASLRMQRCRECNRAYVKAYRKIHPEKVSEWNSRSYQRRVCSL